MGSQEILKLTHICKKENQVLHTCLLVLELYSSPVMMSGGLEHTLSENKKACLVYNFKVNLLIANSLLRCKGHTYFSVRPYRASGLQTSPLTALPPIHSSHCMVLCAVPQEPPGDRTLIGSASHLLFSIFSPRWSLKTVSYR